MQDSWQIVRANDRQLALCLLFAPSADRQLLADIFCLANELENAIRIPSEIMLAAIRLQWWHDALADMTAPAGAADAHIAGAYRRRADQPDELLRLSRSGRGGSLTARPAPPPVLLAAGSLRPK